MMGIMPKRSSKRRPRDLNELAASIVADTTSEEPEPDAPEKNPAAVELGRLGGKKGGKARAARMTPEERAESARRAARVRWAQRPTKNS